MPQWPARELFEEQLFDPASNDLAMTELALRMSAEIKRQNLPGLSDLCRAAPNAFFFKTPTGREDEESAPVDELDLKDSSFAFDAGLAWGVSAGARLIDPLAQEGFKSYVTERFSWSPARRRAALAFASGVLQSPMAPSSLSEWVFDTGSKMLWGEAQFGAAELAIWGEAWTERAKKTGCLPEWCGLVLDQAIRLRCDGAPQEAAIALAFAKNLGAPNPGWLSRARVKAMDRLDTRHDTLREQLRSWVGSGEARDKSFEALTRWSAQWDDQALAVCFEGPASWSESPLSQGEGKDLAAKFEKAALNAATPRGSDAPKPATLRV